MRVEVRERIWRSQSKSYVRLLPQKLGVSPRGHSGGLQRALTDFGCEHSFAKAAQSVREHYGFEIGVSAVRTTTLTHARRAREQLQQQYQQPFRSVPKMGQEHVIAQSDGTMICTLNPGPKKAKRPREWKEMRLWWPFRLRTAPLRSMQRVLPVSKKSGGVGDIARARLVGDLTARSTAWETERSGSDCRVSKSSASREAFCVTFIMSASIWQQQRPSVVHPRPTNGAEHSKGDCGAEPRTKCSRPWSPISKRPRPLRNKRLCVGPGVT